MATEAVLLTILLATSGGAPATNSTITAPHSVVNAAPHLVLVPGSRVRYAPDLDFNLLAYGGRYYRLHDGAWLVAASYRGPWVPVTPDRIPHAVRAVPVAYFRIPPGTTR